MTAPLVSIIIPAYESDGTLAACLHAIRAQLWQDFEVIVVDSSLVDRARPIVAAIYPAATYVHSRVRLLPQAARNHGARHARGELLVFTDPDIYPPPHWLGTLVAAWRRGHAIVLGSIACHGNRWLDRGAHLCAFAICLPGGEAREVPLGWSGNILITRPVFNSAGGWEAGHVQGDSVFTARLRAAGHGLWFEPNAVVFHDHAGLTLRRFWGVRRSRGAEFAAIELAGSLGSSPWGTAITPLRLVPTLALLPLRVVHRALHVFRAARDARLTGDYVRTLPVVVLGLCAWYLGMGQTYWRQAFVHAARD